MATWEDHKCKNRAMRDSVGMQLIADQDTRTMLIMCSPCGERFEYSDGRRLYNVWCMGFRAGKSAASNAAMSVQEPMDANPDPAAEG